MSRKGHKTTDAPSREQKKAGFQSDGNATSNKRRQLTLVGVIVVLCVVAIYVIWGGGRSESALKGGHQAIGTPGQDVQIPLSEVSDGKARFYNYSSPAIRKSVSSSSKALTGLFAPPSMPVMSVMKSGLVITSKATIWFAGTVGGIFHPAA